MNNSTDIGTDLEAAIAAIAYATGTTGLICLLLLLLFLAVEVYYICQHKTDFLQRLFFYLTIAATIAEGACALLFTAVLKDPSYALYTVNIPLAIIVYAHLVEVLVFAAINFTVLSKLYKYTARRHSLHSDKEYILLCCLYTKRKEVVFVTILFSLPILALLTQIAFITSPIRDGRLIFISIVSASLVLSLINLVLSLVSIVVMITWLCQIFKTKLLKSKLCRKAALLVGLLATFLPFWILYPILAVVVLAVSKTAVNATAAVFVAVLQGIIPSIFFVYVCKRVCKKPKKEEMGAMKAMSALSTVPPSTRVSLPTDTALHAPNFLSPSTAEMSSEYNASYKLMT